VPPGDQAQVLPFSPKIFRAWVPSGRQVPKDCRSKPLTVQLSAPAPPGGARLKVSVAGRRPLRVLDLAVREGARSQRIEVAPERSGRTRIRVQAPGQDCELDFARTENACPEVKIEVEATAAVACRPCEAEAPIARPEGLSETEWVCDRGDFYVEARLGARTPCPDFDEKLGRALRESPGLPSLDEAVCSWGANGCEVPCDGEDARVRFAQRRVEVQVERVLQPQQGDAIGHLRFFRVRYWMIDGNRRTQVQVNPNRVCDAVNRLRQAVETVTEQMGAACGVQEQMAECASGNRAAPADYAFNIGQECPIRPSHVGAVATEGMKSWHKRRINGRARPTRVPDVREGRPSRAAGARVALIDTGVHTKIRDAKLKPAASTTDPGDDPQFHGSAMALLMRGIAPNVQIDSQRIMDASGVTTTAELARAIEQAVYAPGNLPLIINLSLGWPGEFSLPWFPQGVSLSLNRDRTWSDHACATVDDGVGEAVRYMLIRARELEASGRRITVVAAAGNVPPVSEEGQLNARQATLRGMDCTNDLERSRRIFQRDPRWSRVSPDRLNPLRASWCSNGKANGPLPYLPGGWSLGAPLAANSVGPGVAPYFNRVTNECSTDALTLTVGAVDAREQTIYTPDPAFKAKLVAPGQHVYVDPPNFPQVAEAGYCGATAPTGLVMPMSFTGTSVSTALVTGVVAAMQKTWAGLGAPGATALKQAELATLLALGSTATTDGARRPSLCRLRALLKEDGCLQSLRCAFAGPRARRCRGVPPPSTACNLNQCLADGDTAAAWPASYAPADCAAVPAAVVQDWNPTCSGTDCLSGHEAGLVGPQPSEPICPDCRFDVDSHFKAVSRVELGTKFPGGQDVRRPRLLVKAGGNYKLIDFNVTGNLKPGWVGKLTNIDVNPISSSLADWKTGSAWFVVELVDQKSGKVTSHYDSMELNLLP
jgi:subtilisin family serine protease